jgi:hypothetical protein
MLIWRRKYDLFGANRMLTGAASSFSCSSTSRPQVHSPPNSLSLSFPLSKRTYQAAAEDLNSFGVLPSYAICQTNTSVFPLIFHVLRSQLFSHSFQSLPQITNWRTLSIRTNAPGQTPLSPDHHRCLSHRAPRPSKRMYPTFERSAERVAGANESRTPIF